MFTMGMIRIFVIGLVFLTPSLHAADMCLQQTFREDFNSEVLNQSLWGYDIGDGCDIDLCGWGNSEEQYYHGDNVSLRDGNLVIRAAFDKDTQRIQSGKITTRNKFAQLYGRFEARVKVPDGLGLWPAFWLMPDQQEKLWPLEGEIDILERPGRDVVDLRTVIGAAHFGDIWPGNTHFAQFLIMPRPWHEDYHVYAVDWSEGQLVWSIDGREFARINKEDVGEFSWPFDSKAFYVILNMAVGGTLGGEVALDALPAEMLVDYVAIYHVGNCSE